MSPLQTKILAVLMSFPRTEADVIRDSDDDYREARLAILAEAIEIASDGNLLLAGALITQAHRESALDSGWSSCNCQYPTCDKGKAHGYYQQHNAPTWPREWWPSLCWTMWLPSMVLAAKLTAARINTSNLECSFAKLGGSTVPCDAPWAKSRAKVARWIAGKLR